MALEHFQWSHFQPFNLKYIACNAVFQCIVYQYHSDAEEVSVDDSDEDPHYEESTESSDSEDEISHKGNGTVLRLQ